MRWKMKKKTLKNQTIVVFFNLILDFPISTMYIICVDRKPNSKNQSKGLKMEIVRKSQISGKEHAMDLNITREQVEAYNNGALLQDAFPNLNAEEREFYKSGITPKEWNDMFAGEDDDE